MAVDLPAYARMRGEGLQPSRTVGAAKVEAQATTKFEVESGHLYAQKDKKHLKAVLSEFAPDKV